MSKNDRDRTLTSPLRYAVGVLGTSIATSLINARGNFFFNDFFGLGLQFIAILNAVYAVLDIFSTPIFGVASDRTNTRFGRRKPWMLISAPLYLLFSVLFFCPPPSIVGSILIVATYYGVFRTFTRLLSSILAINYQALLPELFEDPRLRNKANAISQVMNIVGMIIGVSMVPLIIDAWGYRLVALVTGVIGTVFYLYSTFGCRENPNFASKEESPKLISSMRDILKNRNMLAVGFTHLMTESTLTLTLTSLPFYVRYTLEGASSTEALLSGALFITVIICVYFSSKLVNRFGALKVWRYSLISVALGYGAMYLLNSLYGSIAAVLVIGACYSGFAATTDLMQSRIAEEDAAATGIRREALIFSVLSTFKKLCLLVISFVFMLIFLIYGFESGANPGEHAYSAARSMMTLAPAILMLAAFFASGLVKSEMKVSDE